MGAIVQKQFCHGCDCPKTSLSWVRLSKNKFVMGAIVQKQVCTIPRGAASNLQKENKKFQGNYPFNERAILSVNTKPTVATFGRLFVPKMPQRLQKVTQKRPNGSKAPQKGSEKTTWLAFLNKLSVFSTISSFSLVLASIWLLFALIGSCWLLLAPIALHLLLLPPIVSYCLLAALLVSYWLLMAPLGS